MLPSTRKQYNRMYNFAGDYIYTSIKTSPENKVCDKMAIDLIVSSFKIMNLIFFAMTLSCSGPFYKLILKNEKELIIPVILPFVDPETEHGFYINFCYQIVSCVYGLILIPGSELITQILKNNILVTATVIENSFEGFGRQLEDDMKFSLAHTLELRNILLKIIDFNRFVFCYKINISCIIFKYCKNLFKYS